jgi:uroporphyrinogen decarboxylase
MKPREIVLAQINHRETSPIPYTLPIEWEVSQGLDEHFGDTSWRDRIVPFMTSVGVIDGLKRLPIEGREGYVRDLFGSIWRLDRRPWHMESPGMERPTFEGYDWPAPERFFVDEDQVKQAREHCGRNKSELFISAGLGWGLFESCWGIRGFENVMMDAVAEEDFFEELLDRITEQFLAAVDFTCQSVPDVDAVMFGDDWGDQRGVIIGPERWRRFFKPRWAKIYDRVHGYGKYVMTHCCGSIVDIMDDVVEIGLDVLESCQPEARGMAPVDLKKRWGDKLTFWGCLGSQSTIPFGTPAEIHAEVKRLRAEMGRGGGFILAPAKALQPGTPIENAVAVLEAFVTQA